MATDLYNDLFKEFKKLAKKADQRLVRLEKLQKQEYYKGVTSYAYSRAIADIKRRGGNNRFNVKVPDTGSSQGNIKALQGRINDINRFLESVTSTKKGIDKAYHDRAKKFNEMLRNEYNAGDVQVTWQELAHFYENGKDLLGSKDFKYEQVYQSVIILKRQKNMDMNQLVKNIKDVNNNHIMTDKVELEIQNRLSKLGITYKDIL